MATIASINPFPNDVRIAFQTYIQIPQYSKRNKEWIPYENGIKCVYSLMIQPLSQLTLTYLTRE